MKIALIYGSTDGNTKTLAQMIKEEMGDRITALIDIAQISVNDMQGYDVLILGIPTWEVGELQEDWAKAFDNLDNVDFSGTKVVMFGLGDEDGYPDTYQDAMGILYLKMLERGAEGGIGFWPTDDYKFDESKGVIDGKFCGLAIDQDNCSDKTPERVKAWCAQIKQELGL